MCKRDPDIEIFLKHKGIKFEKLGKSRTFLVFDENKDSFQVLAYFTLAIKILKIPAEMISGQKLKKLDGLSSTIRGKRITELPAILIGQLGKNDLYADVIKGSEVLEYCMAKILEGQQRLGGRIIMLECKNITKIIKLYNDFAFEVLENESDDKELLQLVRILTEDEIIN